MKVLTSEAWEGLWEGTETRRGASNLDLWAKSSSQSVCVNKTLSEHGCTLLSIYCPWLLSHEGRGIKQSPQRSQSPRSLKYVLSGLLQKVFSKLWTRPLYFITIEASIFPFIMWGNRERAGYVTSQGGEYYWQVSPGLILLQVMLTACSLCALCVGYYTKHPPMCTVSLISHDIC